MKPIHNQGKQALKRIRQRLGLPVNREPIYAETFSHAVYLNGESISENPKMWERYKLTIVK